MTKKQAKRDLHITFGMHLKGNAPQQPKKTMHILKFIKSFLFCAALLPLSLVAQPIDSISHYGSVDDYADLFTAQQSSELDSIIRSYSDTVGIVVTTVTSLDGQKISDYATELYKRTGTLTGYGMLILIAPHERKVFTAIGTSLQGEITDGYAGHMERIALMDNFNHGDYYQGTKKLLLAYIGKLRPKSMEYYNAQHPKEIDATAGWFVFPVTISCVIILIYIILVIKNRRQRKRQELFTNCSYLESAEDWDNWHNEADH